MCFTMLFPLPRVAPTPAPVGGGAVMNNGRQDTTMQDMLKLQQQLQDIKDQVSSSSGHTAHRDATYPTFVGIPTFWLEFPY